MTGVGCAVPDVVVFPHLSLSNSRKETESSGVSLKIIEVREMRVVDMLRERERDGWEMMECADARRV